MPRRSYPAPRRASDAATSLLTCVAMRAIATTEAPPATDADTIAVGVFEDEGVAHDHGGVLQALVDSGEAKRAFRKLAVTHADGRRYIVVGLGARGEFDPERARVAAAVVAGRASELGTRTLCWELPHHVSDAHAGALVEGTALASYAYTEFKSSSAPEGSLEALLVSAHHDVTAAVAYGAAAAEAANAARDLQNRPANVLTPTALAERAQALDGVTVEVLDGAAIEAAGMGAFAAVARGSYEDARLITVRYEPEGIAGPLLGFVGKAVTFDSGGISIKPAAKMHEMKFDMSGGAAVLEAVGAIARLALPVRVVGVIGATENLPSGRSMKPGDIVRAKTGLTIEINNTDAEGRLVLADCLAHAVDLGAERLVDLATLTGAMVVALGHTYAGLFATDDAWAAEILAAAERTGELAWRLPLHPEYAKAIEGRYADISNHTGDRAASSATAAEFLKRFTGDVPWGHLDIAGTAYDLGRPYAPKGAAGFGTRLLIDLARGEPAAPDIH
jgi:leucyl aminopeptidase